MKTVFSIRPVDAEMRGIMNHMPVRVTSRRGEIVLHATVTEKTKVGVVFIAWHFPEAACGGAEGQVLENAAADTNRQDSQPNLLLR
jgi:anaerobic selenocysteine-containing dehydrogenase